MKDRIKLKINKGIHIRGNKHTLDIVIKNIIKDLERPIIVLEVKNINENSRIFYPLELNTQATPLLPGFAIEFTDKKDGWPILQHHACNEYTIIKKTYQRLLTRNF